MFFSRVRVRPEILRSSQLGKVLEGNAYSMHRLLWGLFPDQENRNYIYREEIAREQLGVITGVRGEPIYYIVSHAEPVVQEGGLFDLEIKRYDPRLVSGQPLSFKLRANPVVSRDGKKHDVAMDAQLNLLKQLCSEMNLLSALPDNPKKGYYKKILISKGGEELDKYLTRILNNDWRYSDRLGQVTTLADKLERSLKANIDTSLEKWLVRQGDQYGFALAKDKNEHYKLQNTAYRWHALLGKGKKGDKSGFSSVDFAGELQVTDADKFISALYKGIGRSKAFGCGLMLVRRITRLKGMVPPPEKVVSLADMEEAIAEGAGDK